MEAAPVRGSLSDFFGFGERGLSREQVQANRTYIEQYQQMLNASGVPSPGGSLNPGLSPEVTPAPAYRGLDALTASTQPADAPTSARSRSSVLDPFRLPDPNKAVTQWDPLYEPPKIELARPTSFFTPPIEAPRRRF
jgi:hypothetical protein